MLTVSLLEDVSEHDELAQGEPGVVEPPDAELPADHCPLFCQPAGSAGDSPMLRSDIRSVPVCS